MPPKSYTRNLRKEWWKGTKNLVKKFSIKIIFYLYNLHGKKKERTNICVKQIFGVGWKGKVLQFQNVAKNCFSNLVTKYVKMKKTKKMIV